MLASPVMDVAQKLADPETAAKLARLLERSDEIIALLDMIEGTLKRGPEYADNINSLVRQLRALDVGSGGIEHLCDSLSRLKRLSESPALKKLEDKFTDEKSVEAMLSLLNNLGEISALMEMLVSALQRGPEYADNINGLLKRFRESSSDTLTSLGTEIRSLNLPALRNTALQLTALIQSQQMQSLLASEIFGVDSIALVDRFARVAREASVEARIPGPRIGIFAIFKYLSDPDIQTTLRFLFGFAKKLGRELSQDARAIDSKKPD